MDKKSIDILFKEIHDKAISNQDPTDYLLQIMPKLWDQSFSPTELDANTKEFMNNEGHLRLREMLISNNSKLEDIALIVLNYALAEPFIHDLVIFYATDELSVNAFVKLLGAAGEHPLHYLWTNSTSQNICCNNIGFLSVPHEVRALLTKKVLPALQSNILSVPNHSNTFEAYLAIAILIGNSDSPEDLNIISHKEPIDEIVYAFINGRSKNKSDCWPLKLLALPLRNLAANLKSRKILHDCGIVKPLIQKLTEDEIRKHPFIMENTVGILVNLAFDSEIAKELKEAGAIEKLQLLLNMEVCNGFAKKQIEQALWLLNPPKHTEVVNSAGAGDKAGHIMISYCWAQKEIILKLKQFLNDNGLKVWIDIEQMKGSTLNAMAEAIENAFLILICYSQRYKDSSNCQIEGEYCHQQGKPFLPVLVEANYKPTGWLGALLGTKLYYNLGKKFDSDIKLLLAEISKFSSSQSFNPSTPIQEKAPKESRKPVNLAATWDQIKVTEWLNEIGLGYLGYNFINEEMDGQALERLNKLTDVAFLQAADILGIQKLGHKLNLKSRIETLFLNT